LGGVAPGAAAPTAAASVPALTPTPALAPAPALTPVARLVLLLVVGQHLDCIKVVGVEVGLLPGALHLGRLRHVVGGYIRGCFLARRARRTFADGHGRLKEKKLNIINLLIKSRAA